MKIYRHLQEIQTKPTSCAMGMFDGVHIGHGMVLEQAIRQAKIQGLRPVVFTFANHPQSIISQTPTPLLSTLAERIQAFKDFGFDAALILDFTPELKDMPAALFVKSLLIDTLHVKAVSIGYDHRFGKNRVGDGVFLKEMGEQFGFEVDIVSPVKAGDQIVSSTLIRKLLSFGDLSKAKQLLGRPYTLTAPVVAGDGRGRTIGFPTANMAVPSERLMPANGVYAGLAQVDGSLEQLPAVCNIGHAPTFGDAIAMPRMEVHVLQNTENLYGKNLTFTFLHYLRQEHAFESVQALISQLKEDCRQAQVLIGQ